MYLTIACDKYHFKLFVIALRTLYNNKKGQSSMLLSHAAWGTWKMTETIMAWFYQLFLHGYFEGLFTCKQWCQCSRDLGKCWHPNVLRNFAFVCSNSLREANLSWKGWRCGKGKDELDRNSEYGDINLSVKLT